MVAFNSKSLIGLKALGLIFEARGLEVRALALRAINGLEAIFI